MKRILVTRHPALKDMLMNKIGHDFDEVIEHANEEEIKGAHVFGVLPLYLASKAAKITEVCLKIPQEKRGKELSFEELSEYFAGLKTYEVKEI
jgi:putative CRISPR-associated protein (TIGR02620 family)